MLVATGLLQAARCMEEASTQTPVEPEAHGAFPPSRMAGAAHSRNLPIAALVGPMEPSMRAAQWPQEQERCHLPVALTT